MPSNNEVHDTLIVGAGFTGLGAAIRLRQAGIDDIVLARTCRPGRRHLARQRLPRCRVRHPVTAVLVLVRQEPVVVARLPVRRGDLRPYRGPGRPVRASPTDPVQHRGHRTGVRRVSRRLDRHDEAAQAVSGTHRGARVRTACRPRAARHPGHRHLSGPQDPQRGWDHDYDFTGKRVAVIGTGASAVQIVPELVKSRAVRQGVPAHAGLGAAPPGRAHARRRAVAVRHGARHPGARPPALFWGHEASAAALVWNTPMSRLVARLGRAHLASPGEGSVAAPTAHPGVHARAASGC